MSLIKQLWMGIILILLLALGGSFSISLMTAKHYLEEQLRLKNIDNANSLALTLSQTEKDTVSLNIFLSAQFDTGHYEYIKLIDPNNKILLAKEFDETSKLSTGESAPLWFSNWINFDASEGVAQIQNGWQQYGTVHLKSHSRFASLALWQNTKNLFFWFFIAATISGVIGTIILRFISSPLERVIKQAEAISERRFITSDEPKTFEFQRLVKAMNALSLSVKHMLEKETKLLDKVRRESQLDPLTELPNREYFLNLLESQLNRDDNNSQGTVVLIRLSNLTELNHHWGRSAADYTLLQIAGVLHQYIERNPSSHAGRLNGSDFILMVSNNPCPSTLGSELAEQLHHQLASCEISNIQLPIAVASYTAGEDRQTILLKLDGALAQAELKGNKAVIVVSDDTELLAHKNLNEWRETIAESLADNRLSLATFPVKDSNGDLLHIESPVRLQMDNNEKSAGYFMPWAARLGMLPAIDLQVVKCAIDLIHSQSVAVAINISADSLRNLIFREETLDLLQKNIEHNSLLWIEFPESCALRHLPELRSFINSLRAMGCYVGLEHVGIEFTKITELQDIGLHYLKVDEAIIRDIDTNEGNQNFLSGMCKIGHSLGILMIAEGVKTENEKSKLIRLGMDAMTGPAII